jgi:uncharacterized membrane protein (DUF2068 family)
VPATRRAPTLWAIIVVKLLRGILLLYLAVGAYRLVGQELRPHFEDAVRLVKLDPETEFFVHLGDWLDAVKPSSVAWIATGALLYGLLSLAEGIGLILRLRAVGWLVLAESAFFIPVECNALLREFTVAVLIILLINVGIVVYLWRNRERLFKH